MVTPIKRWPLWLWYTLGFGLIAGLSFGIFILAGRTLIWNLDGISQHYPILLTMQHLLQTQGPAGLFGWSFNMGLGADQLTTLSYYVLGDPFSYLIVLFPPHLAEVGYGLLIILRLYVTGLAFLAFAHRYQFSRPAQLLGSLTYAFTGYSLYVADHHPFFLLPMILFPLLAVGIDKVYRGETWLVLGAVTGLSIFSNFYFAYVLALGSLLYAGLHYVYLKARAELKITAKQLWRPFGLAAVTGTLLSGALLVPSLLMMSHATRAGGRFANGLWHYPLSYYLQIPNNLLTTGNAVNYWLIIAVSGLGYLALVYVLAHWRDYRVLALTLVISLIGLGIPAVGAIFNVFSTPSNRWLLLTTLAFGLALMTLVDHLTQLTARDVIILSLATVGLLVAVWLGNGFIFNNRPHDFLTYGLLLLTLLVIVNARQWPRTFWLLIGSLVSVNLVNNAWGFYDPDAGSQATQQLRQGDATRYLADYYDGAQKAVTQTAGFYRTNTSPNYSVLNTVGTNVGYFLQTHDVMSYYSVQNGYLGAFSQAVGNSQAAMNAPIGQLDGRTSLDNLLGVRYLFAKTSQVTNKAALPYGYQPIKHAPYPEQPVYGLSNGDGTTVLESKNALPLVYSQPVVLSPTAFDRLNEVDREQAMTQAAVMDTAATQHVATAKLQSTAQTLPYTTMVNKVPIIDNLNKVIQYRLKQNAAAKSAQLNNRQAALHPEAGQLPPMTPDKNGLLPSKEVQQYAPMVDLQQNQAALTRVLKENQRIELTTAVKNATQLHQLTVDAQGQPLTYELTLPDYQKTAHAELYLKLSGISATSRTTADQLTYADNTSILGDSPLSTLTRLNKWRDALWNPDLGDYSVTVKTRNANTGFKQLGIDNMSDFEPKQSVLLNLGYADASRRTVDVTFAGTKSITFKRAELMVVPFNRTYDQRMQRLQARGLQHASIQANRITGQLTTTAPSVLTTSIPYSTGWHLTVDGRPVATQVVNEGFVGAPIGAGTHRIRLTYQTPGVVVGCVMSVLGLGLLLVGIISDRRRRRS